MGVLDDAIREHLELKRKHGSSQEEVEAQQQEALGPPVRQPLEAPQGPAATEQPAAEVPAAEVPAPAPPVEPEPAPPVEPDPVPPVEPDPEPPFEPQPDPPVEPEPALEPEPQGGPPTESYDVESELAAGDTPPRGFDRVDDAPLPAEDAGDEDVLEETPDFLQETPEHDRLWFEQKPPRDFDFDDE